MPTAGVDDDDFEALLLEHVDALGGDDDRIRFGVAAVERYSSFRRVLEKVKLIDLDCQPSYVAISAIFTTDIPKESRSHVSQLKP